MSDDDERWDWHQQRGVTWAAGAAAVALIVLLVVAVIRTATSSHVPAGPPGTSDVTTSGSWSQTASSSTSYTMPSVQTSDGSGPEVSAPPPTGEAPQPEDPGTPTTTSTTIANPYVTTTTQNGGAV